MTNEQFQKLKKVFNFVKPGIKSIGDNSFATILTLLSEYDIDYKHFVVVDNKYVSFMFSDLSKLTLKNGKKGFILTWTNKPRLDKFVKPEPMYKSKDFVPLSQWLEKGNSRDSLLEIKTKSQGDNPVVDIHVFSTLVKKDDDMYKIKGAEFFYFENEIYVRMPEISNSTTNTSSELMLVDYLAKGYKLEDVREVKIVEGMYSAGVTSEYVGNSYKSSLVEVNTMTFDLIGVSPAVVNADFFIDEILVTDWIESPSTGAGQSKDCGQEIKFIPLPKWLETKSPVDISKARVKGTPILSDNVYLLTNDKCFLDDRTTKYHINQIEVK